MNTTPKLSSPVARATRAALPALSIGCLVPLLATSAIAETVTRVNPLAASTAFESVAVDGPFVTQGSLGPGCYIDERGYRVCIKRGSQ